MEAKNLRSSAHLERDEEREEGREIQPYGLGTHSYDLF